MPPPLIGPWPVTVHAVQPFSIHGDIYYQLDVSPTDDPTTVTRLRIPQHVLTPPPTPGDRLTLTFLMSQVTGAKREA